MINREQTTVVIPLESHELFNRKCECGSMNLRQLTIPLALWQIHDSRFVRGFESGFVICMECKRLYSLV